MNGRIGENRRRDNRQRQGDGQGGNALHCQPTLQCICRARQSALTDCSTKVVNQIAMLIVEDQDGIRRKLREYLRSTYADVGNSRPVPFKKMTVLLSKITGAPEGACL